jgi:hypothetical protein
MKLLISLFSIAICIGAYFVYIKPMVVEVKVLGAQKKEYTNLLNTVQEIKEKRDAVLQDYNSLSPEEISRLNKIIPDTFNSVLLLNNLNGIAQRHNVVIKDYKANDSDMGGGVVIDGTGDAVFKTSTINLKVIAQYSDFLSFMKELESSLTLMDIIKLSIDKGLATPTTQGKVVQNSASMDYVLEAKVYSLK